MNYTTQEAKASPEKVFSLAIYPAVRDWLLLRLKAGEKSVWGPSASRPAITKLELSASHLRAMTFRVRLSRLSSEDNTSECDESDGELA